MISTKAYMEGQDAYWKRADTMDNQYDPNTSEHKDWREGFEIELLEESCSYEAYYGE